MKKVVLVVLILIVVMSWASEADWTYDEVENIVLGNVTGIDTSFCQVSLQKISGIIFPVSAMTDVSSSFEITDSLNQKIQKDFENKLKGKNLSEKFDFEVKIKSLGYYPMYVVGSNEIESFQRIEIRFFVTEKKEKKNDF